MWKAYLPFVDCENPWKHGFSTSKGELILGQYVRFNVSPTESSYKGNGSNGVCYRNGQLLWHTPFSYPGKFEPQRFHCRWWLILVEISSTNQPLQIWLISRLYIGTPPHKRGELVLPNRLKGNCCRFRFLFFFLHYVETLACIPQNPQLFPTGHRWFWSSFANFESSNFFAMIIFPIETDILGSPFLDTAHSSP